LRELDEVPDAGLGSDLCEADLLRLGSGEDGVTR
jgi:hypothetical protein